MEKIKNIFECCATGDYDAACDIISSGASVDVFNSDNLTPLMVSIINKQERIIDLLMGCGSDSNLVDNQKRSPLMYASSLGLVDISKLLLMGDADINSIDEDGKNALIYAIVNQENSVMELLLSNKIDCNVVDKQGYTPLHYAVMVGNEKAVKMLIKNSADINATTLDNKNAIHLALEGKFDDIANILIEAGVDLGPQDDSGCTPLMKAIMQEQNDLAYKLVNDKSVNLQDKNGNTPLMIAAAMGNSELIKHLLKNNADIEKVNVDGMNALAISSEVKMAAKKPNSALTTTWINYSKKRKRIHSQFLKKGASGPWSEVIRQSHVSASQKVEIDNEMIRVKDSSKTIIDKSGIRIPESKGNVDPLEEENNSIIKDNQNEIINIPTTNSKTPSDQITGNNYVHSINESSSDITKISTADSNEEDNLKRISGIQADTIDQTVIRVKDSVQDSSLLDDDLVKVGNGPRSIIPEEMIKVKAINMALNDNLLIKIPAANHDKQSNEDSAAFSKEFRNTQDEIGAEAEFIKIIDSRANPNKKQEIIDLLQGQTIIMSNENIPHIEEPFFNKGIIQEKAEKTSTAVNVLSDSQFEIKEEFTSPVKETTTNKTEEIGDKKFNVLNSKLPKGQNVLMFAAAKGSLEMVQKVMSQVDVNARDFSGYTAVTHAAIGGHLEIVKYLIENGAKVEEKIVGKVTPLAWAVLKGHTEVVRYLLKSGANVQVKIKGTPMLNLAALSNNLEMVKCLVEYKIDINNKDHKGLTALDYAKKKNFTKIVDYIEGIIKENAEKNKSSSSLKTGVAKKKYRMGR